MRGVLLLTAILFLAVTLSGSAGANGSSGGAAAWAGYEGGLLAVGGAPGAPFTAVDLNGCVTANGHLASDGLAIVLAAPTAAINIGGDTLAVGGSDQDWNW